MIKSGMDVGNKGTCWNGSSEFMVDSEVRAAQRSEAAQYDSSQVTGALCARSDAAFER